MSYDFSCGLCPKCSRYARQTSKCGPKVGAIHSWCCYRLDQWCIITYQSQQHKWHKSRSKQSDNQWFKPCFQCYHPWTRMFVTWCLLTRQWYSPLVGISYHCTLLGAGHFWNVLYCVRHRQWPHSKQDSTHANSIHFVAAAGTPTDVKAGTISIIYILAKHNHSFK